MAGEMGPDANRLADAPRPLADSQVVDLEADVAGRASRIADGEAALARKEIAIAILNGGMAMRFGGGAKGVVPLLEDSSETFLSTKLRQVVGRGTAVGAPIPTVIMHSFATEAPSHAHLESLDWCGLPHDHRREVVQSIMPRVHPDGRALHDDPACVDMPDTSVYAAPGHGDFLATMRASKTVDWLRAHGVKHVLMSNVDNLGASLEPEVIGAHVQAAAAGRGVTVEGVQRRAGEKGGCIAMLGETPAIVEGFRLPRSVDMDTYPLFNTNTLWFTLDTLATPVPLDWFAVHRTVSHPSGEAMPIVQFEQLVGQVTEFVPSQMLRVARARRFLPIKTRDDLARMADDIRTIVTAAAPRST